MSITLEDEDWIHDYFEIQAVQPNADESEVTTFVGAVRRRAGAETFRLLPLFLYSLLALLGAGALLKPGFDLGPEALLGAASGHKADMAGVDDEELFFFARYQIHDGFGLR